MRSGQEIDGARAAIYDPSGSMSHLAARYSGAETMADTPTGRSYGILYLIGHDRVGIVEKSKVTVDRITIAK